MSSIRALADFFCPVQKKKRTAAYLCGQCFKNVYQDEPPHLECQEKSRAEELRVMRLYVEDILDRTFERAHSPCPELVPNPPRPMYPYYL